MTLPKLLVIDDQFARSRLHGQFAKTIRDRRNLCRVLGLTDETGDDRSPVHIETPVASAFFSPGQVWSGDRIENSLPLCLEAVRQGWPPEEDDAARWALVLLDLRFTFGRIDDEGEPEEASHFGLEAVLPALRREFPDLPVVVLSSVDKEAAHEAVRRGGACDFIQRTPAESDVPAKAMLAAKLRDFGLLEDEHGVIAGRSVALLKTLAGARRAATGKGNILLLGETGTGKELLARYVHDQSPKSRGPYVVFHAFGQAETLQEDELFGHVKGAFTGADAPRLGCFEIAHGGTLFIDEVADISGAVQNKLLRPIETRKVKRQGTNAETDIDVQLILATNKDLDAYAQKGHFKSDLLNRIRAYPISLPPLRNRKADIVLVAERLLVGICAEHEAKWPRRIHCDALASLRKHDWREGNVRALRNVLTRAVINHRDDDIMVASDIEFDGPTGMDDTEVGSQIGGSASTTALSGPAISGLDELIEMLEGFQFPSGYDALSGQLPRVQNAVASLLARYLNAALVETRKKRPGAPDDINLAGAASCILGNQVKSSPAADLVKRLLRMDEDVREDLFREYPLLREAFRQSLELRPSQSPTRKTEQ
ncbi:MAG: sigma 54-interacting transcriptional regulator [Thermoguttaceae bacterium]